MGWWQIDVTDAEAEAFDKSDKMLYNALPDEDNPKRLYSGDQPADIMSEAIDEINEVYKKTWKRKVTLRELRCCFDFCTGPMEEDEVSKSSIESHNGNK